MHKQDIEAVNKLIDERFHGYAHLQKQVEELQNKLRDLRAKHLEVLAGKVEDALNLPSYRNELIWILNLTDDST